MSGLTPITVEWVHTFDRLVQLGCMHVVTNNGMRVYRLRAADWRVHGVEFDLVVPWSQVAASFLPRDLNDRESEIAFGILEAVEEDIKHTDRLNESINAYMGKDKWEDPDYAKDDEIRAVIDRMRDLLGVQP